MFFGSQTRELLRTRPNPLTWERARARRGARPAGRPPRPSAEPVTVQRRASNTGVIMVAGQKSALGRIYCGQIVTVHVADTTRYHRPGLETTSAASGGPPHSPSAASRAHRPRHADAENQEAAR